MSIWTRIFILLFPVIVYVVLNLIFKVLKLKNRGSVKVFDVLLIFLVLGLEGFMKSTTATSILPYYFMLISGVGLFLLLIDLFVIKEFQFSNFFRRFWRAVSIDTGVMYFCLIIAALFMA